VVSANLALRLLLNLEPDSFRCGLEGNGLNRGHSNSFCEFVRKVLVNSGKHRNCNNNSVYGVIALTVYHSRLTLSLLDLLALSRTKMTGQVADEMFPGSLVHDLTVENTRLLEVN
jgi:hypothetical protein